MNLTKSKGGLTMKLYGETLLIQPWGKNAFRVRATRYPDFTGNNYALEEEIPTEKKQADICIAPEGNSAEITNGRLKITVNPSGVLRYFKYCKDFFHE